MRVMEDITNEPAPNAASVAPSPAKAVPAAEAELAPAPLQLAERVLLSSCFLMRCDWQSVGLLAMVCKSWAKVLFGEEQAEATWQAVCQSI
eukprot:SAG22_NODE_15367_length_350_cov_1.027888_1_plen_90_part_10